MPRNMIVLLWCCLFVNVAHLAVAKGDTMVIKDGSTVSIDYTLTVDGEVIDTSKDRGPLQYTQGKQQIIPGLERQLAGLTAGDEKEVTVAPEDGYGPVNREAFKEVPRSSLPADLKPVINMMLEMRTKDGQSFPVRIAEVKDDAIVIDLNHPLAGKTLLFKVKVVSVN